MMSLLGPLSQLYDPSVHMCSSPTSPVPGDCVIRPGNHSIIESTLLECLFVQLVIVRESERGWARAIPPRTKAPLVLFRLWEISCRVRESSPHSV
jgi:hypothetical protein